MNKKFRTMLTIVLAFVMAACITSFVACGYNQCKHNYVDGVCTFCNEPDPDYVYAISITNKDALATEWVEASEARTLEVTITLKGEVVTGKDYMCNTSDASVVDVADDNKTLTAAGEGAATITVTTTDIDGNEISDSVEITVIPYLRGIEISNKEELSEVWVLGDSARTLQVGFNPEYYNNHKPEYTVTSSDESVVSVGSDKKTLTAKKVGTATITVATEDFSNTLELTVRPEFQSFEISNKAAMSATWNDWTQTRTLELAMNPAEYYTTENTKVQISASQGLISVNEETLTLTAKKVGTAIVTVTVLNRSESFEVVIERSAPTVKFSQMSGFEETAEGGTIGMLDGETLTVPTATARTCDGTYVDVTVELLDTEGATLANGKITATKTGDTVNTYRLSYKAVDRENDQLVAEKIVTVKVARNVYEKTDGTWTFVEGQKYVDDKDQQLTITKNGYQLGAFKLEASEYYYAEVEYYTTEYLGGLAHYTLHEDGSVNLNRSLVSFAGNKDINYKFIDFDTARGWDVQEGNGKLKVIYQYRLKEYWNHSEHEDSAAGARVSKIAIARIGDYFVNFWNDQYILMYTDEFYAGQKTVPGVFVNAYLGNVEAVKNVVYYSGKDAVNAKVAALTHNGKDVNVNYVPSDWAADSKNDNERNFTSYEIDEERGIHLDTKRDNVGMNNAMFSNNVWFDGDFTYQWDFTATSGSYRSFIELRGNYWYDEYGIQFGAQYDAGKYNRSLLNANKNAEGAKWYEGGQSLDNSKGIRFTISRKLHEDYAEITMTTMSIAKPWQTFTRTVNFGATADKSSDGKTAYTRWNEPVTVQWHNVSVAGKYSNITWTNSATEHTYHVYSDLSYTWSDDNATCTAKYACGFDGCADCIEETVTATSEVTTKQSCENDEITTYTATFENEAFATQTKEVKTNDKLGHDMIDVGELEATTEHPGHNAHKACQRKGCNYKEGYEEYPQLESAPKINFTEVEGFTLTNDGGTLNALEGTATLPVATAKSWKLADVTVSVTLLDEGATLENNALTASKGEYRVEYQAIDPDNAELVTTLEVTVKLYRDLIRWNDSTWSYQDGKKLVADEEQTLVNSTNGYQFLALNATASDYYYAEVEYTAIGYRGGMAHFTLNEDNSLNTKRMLVTVANGNDVNYKVADFDTTADTNAWSVQEGLADRKVVYKCKLTKHSGYTENAKCNGDTKVAKFAIARMGDNFMTFWNDQYVTTYVSSYYSQGNTVPGLFIVGGNTVNASAIKYVSGQAAIDKVKEVTHNGKDLTLAYLGSGDDGIMNYFSGSKNTDNKNFTSNEYSEERGLNYDFTNSTAEFNGGMTSNGVWFDGDFTYQWDYIGTEGTYRSLIEIRDRWYNETNSNPNIQFGVQWNTNEGTSFGFYKFLLNTAKNSGWHEPGSGADASKGMRFTISRKLHENYAEWTMTAQSIANPEQKYTRTIYCSDTQVNDDVVSGCSRWDEVVTVQWHNFKLAGQYSNIKWHGTANYSWNTEA